MDDQLSDSIDEERNARPAGRETTAGDVIRIASLWVAAGALFKLFAGSPNDLPPMVKGWYSDPILTFKLAIAVELCIVTLGLFRPRMAWIPLVLLYGVFDWVLWPLVREGAESCGCMGSSITIPPWVMMAVDSLLLVSILAVRPWSALRRQPLRPLVILPLFAVAGWAPWHIFKTVTIDPPAVTVGTEEGSSSEAEIASSPDPDSSPTGSEAPVAPAGWAPPDPLPLYYGFNSDKWVGEDLHETDLGSFLDVDLLPPDCHVVFYRQQCDHCAKHLQDLAMQEQGPLPLALVRVPERGDTPDNEVTQMKPLEYLPFELPTLDRGYGFKHDTPIAMDVAGWIATSVESVEVEDEGN